MWFDLRFPCFGGRLRLLERASSISVTYRGRAMRDRFGNRAWTGRLGPVELDLPTGASDGEETTDGTDEGEDTWPITLHHIGAHPDVDRAGMVVTTVELRGPRHGRLPVVIRPELFHFSVTTPHGNSLECSLPPTRVRPYRDFFTRLGRRRLRLELSIYCPHEAFSTPGVYEVVPMFRSEYNGEDVGLRAWTGHVTGRTFLLRVRRGGRSDADPVEIHVSDVVESRGVGDAR